ncbi:MAG: hypothetical protein ABIH40_06245 [Candidatus Omnitrophota bacterium]
MLNRRFKKGIFINILVLFLCNGFLLSVAYAYEVVRVDQSKIRLSIPPGQSQAGIINIENPSSEEQFVQIYLEDWYYSPTADGTKEFVLANSTPLSCASWINFSPAELSLPPFSRGKIHYTVRVPSNVKGGRYAVLFVENLLGQPEAKEGAVGVGLAIRMAVLFYIEVAGTVERSGSIDNLRLKLQPDDVLSVSTEFKNTGNVDITAGGTFNIIDSAGMVYARGEFNDVYTLPGDDAVLQASSSGERLRPGGYDLIVTLDLGKALEGTGIGKGVMLVKEARLEVGENGQIVSLGRLR